MRSIAASRCPASYRLASGIDTNRPCIRMSAIAMFDRPLQFRGGVPEPAPSLRRTSRYVTEIRRSIQSGEFSIQKQLIIQRANGYEQGTERYIRLTSQTSLQILSKSFLEYLMLVEFLHDKLSTTTQLYRLYDVITKPLLHLN